uniref:COP9 signalosome complex subunit 8 isoform X1 n=1 Tax=Myxine glutinosa TaxID=7769 RepID=UPI00358E180E
MLLAVMAEANSPNFTKLLEQCESQELEAPGGIATPQVYGQLLALYLLNNDVNNARYLWKKIPQSIKTYPQVVQTVAWVFQAAALEMHANWSQGNPELGAVWSIGQRMCQRDFPGVYSTVGSYTWSDALQPILHALREATQKRALSLVAQAYTSISIEDLADFLGLPGTEAMQAVTEHGWQADTNTRMVIPKKPESLPMPLIPSEQQLARLTDYVSFLEI